MKTSHLMLMLGAFAAGIGLMFRSYRTMPAALEDLERSVADKSGQSHKRDQTKGE